MMRRYSCLAATLAVLLVCLLQPGARADVAVWDLSGVEGAGSWDPAALLLAGPLRARHVFVEGRPVVTDGQIATVDLPRILERQRALARRLAEIS